MPEVCASAYRTVERLDICAAASNDCIDLWQYAEFGIDDDLVFSCTQDILVSCKTEYHTLGLARYSDNVCIAGHFPVDEVLAGVDRESGEGDKG